MILVTGATGNVGRALVDALAADGQAVRGMTRRPESAGFPAGVEAVYGDAGEPDSLTEAFRGVRRAFLMTAQPPGSAPTPTHDAALAEAARRAGVEHVVKLSVYHVDPDGDPLSAWNAAAEKAATDGLPATVLRPGRYMSNALHWVPMIGRGDTVYVPFAHRLAASIDPADIATLAAAALTTDTHVGAVYQLSGPAALTPVEELAILGAALGRKLEAVEPPVSAFRDGMIGSGMSPEVVDAVLDQSIHSDLGAQVLPGMAELLGRPQTTFAEWVAANVKRFS